MTEDQNKQFQEPSANQPAGDASAEQAKEAEPVKEGTAPAGKEEEADTSETTPETAKPESTASENAAEEQKAEVTKEEGKMPEVKNEGETEKVDESGDGGEAAEVAGKVADAKAEASEKKASEESKAPEKPAQKAENPENANPPKKDFDWEKFEGGIDDYSDNERDNLEKLYAETLSDVQEREVVKGKVVSITDKDVVLNIGFKSDGLVPLSEFKYKKNLQPGDEVEVLVETKEDKNGQIILSHRKALAESAWDTIVDAYENEKILEGYVKDRTKGGMIVEVLTLDAFMPGSQIDIKPIKDYDAFVGQTMDIKVVKLNPAFRNIVVSHKAIIESDLEQQKTEILSKLEKGQVLEGIVKNLTSFGVFVDLGGVDGLVHITDVSWGRISHPEEVLELGEKINVVVLDYDKEKKRISLGMKQLTPHPWETLPEDVKEGSRVTGKVVNIEDYGAFIEIQPGVEGLVHVSEMSWSNHLKSPQEYLSLGEEVETAVLNIDREERKLSLGIKQLNEDPWEKVEEKYPVGSKHNAVVRGMMNFGLFVELEEGIDGLVHISDLSWTKKYNHPGEFTKTGEELEVMVLDIDKENRRLSLGVKQLEEDPWDTFESIFLQGSVHEGTVIRIEDKGDVVQLPYSVEGFAPNKHLLKEDKSRPKVDETLSFKIREFDKENRKIIVSHTDIWKEEERRQKQMQEAGKTQEDEETRKALQKMKAQNPASSLSDNNALLQELKDKMMGEEQQKQKQAMQEMEQKLQTKKAEDDTEEAATEEPEAEATEEKPKAKKAAKKTATKKAKAEKPAEAEEDTSETEKDEEKSSEGEKADTEEVTAEKAPEQKKEEETPKAEAETKEDENTSEEVEAEAGSEEDEGKNK